MYAFERCNKYVCEHMLHDAYDNRITTNKQEKYMLCLPKPDSTVSQTGPSGFAKQNQQNQNIWFIKPKPPIFKT
jgi:hypothetical protein